MTLGMWWWWWRRPCIGCVHVKAFSVICQCESQRLPPHQSFCVVCLLYTCIFHLFFSISYGWRKWKNCLCNAMTKRLMASVFLGYLQPWFVGENVTYGNVSSCVQMSRKCVCVCCQYLGCCWLWKISLLTSLPGCYEGHTWQGCRRKIKYLPHIYSSHLSHVSIPGHCWEDKWLKILCSVNFLVLLCCTKDRWLSAL